MKFAVSILMKLLHFIIAYLQKLDLMRANGLAHRVEHVLIVKNEFLVKTKRLLSLVRKWS